MYESRHQPPLKRRAFLRRMLLHTLLGCALIGASLAIGMAGYVEFESLPWRDAFLNAAMLLGGMGPVDPPMSDAGKLFAGFYALYSGLVFLIAVAIMVAPLMHRILHLFHWETREGG